MAGDARGPSPMRYQTAEAKSLPPARAGRISSPTRLAKRKSASG